MTALIRRHQIWTFFALTLVLGWIPWYTGIGSIFYPAPLIAALIVTYLANGTSGLRAVLERMTRWRVGLRWYAFVLLIPVAVAFAAIGVHLLAGGGAPEFPIIGENPAEALLVFIAFLLPWQSSAFFEEVGFRGYALAQHQMRWGPLPGTLLLGAFFGAWLLPEFLEAGTAQEAMGGLGFYPWFIVTEIAWSVLMTWVYNRTGGSALVAGYLFHAVFNSWTLLLLTDATLGDDGFEPFDTQLFVINALVLAAVAIGFIAVTGGRLGYEEAEGADEAVPITLSSGSVSSMN
jgi:membrane protease YdiL (CAAX protease family)